MKTETRVFKYPPIQATGMYEVGNMIDGRRAEFDSLDSAVAYVMEHSAKYLRAHHPGGTLIIIYDRNGDPCQGYNYRPHTNSYMPSPVFR